jgi:hypothetical protein
MIEPVTDNVFDITPPSENRPDAIIDSPSAQIRTRFTNERKEWRDRLMSMAAMLKQPHKLVDLQVDLHNERQRAVEYKSELLDILLVGSTKQKRSHSSTIERLKAQGYKPMEIKSMIEGEFAMENERQELFRHHIDYLQARNKRDRTHQL